MSEVTVWECDICSLRTWEGNLRWLHAYSLDFEKGRGNYKRYHFCTEVHFEQFQASWASSPVTAKVPLHLGKLPAHKDKNAVSV